MAHHYSKYIQKDRDLKHYISGKKHLEPAYQWDKILTEKEPCNVNKHEPEIKIIIVEYDREESLNYPRIAYIIGRAITNLHMALGRDAKGIFSLENQEFVSRVTNEIYNHARQMARDHLCESPSEDPTFNLHINDLNRLIEKTLVDFNAYDVAKSFVLDQALQKKEQHEPSQVIIKVIRRNNQVVSWNTSKIEVAVRKAFLSLEMDSAPAVDIVQNVRVAVEDRHKDYIHIEDIQNIIQEELMKAGHYKVAESYIIYRNTRALSRQIEAETQDALTPESAQLKIILVTKEDETSYMWDGRDLRERITYATLGLELNLSKDEIETELRRSIYENISEKDLKKTITLNAKALIEKDADFALFSARILLSYLYEEVLEWSIIKDGIGKLKEAHERYFKHYLTRGIKIGILDESIIKAYKRENSPKFWIPVRTWVLII